MRPALSVLALIAALTLAACGDGAGTPADASPGTAGALPVSSRAEAEALMARAQVAAALDHLKARRETTLADMVALNEIAAPPFNEEARAGALAARLRALGLEDVSLDAVGNVRARRPGTGNGRTLAIVAHLDTVFPAGTDVTVRQDGASYAAPGIGDNTRGLALMLALADALERAGIRTASDILFVGSVGEEGLGDLRGVRHLFRGEHGITGFIAIDGGQRDRLVVSAVGSNRYRVTFRGPGGHSYGAFGRAHPHQALARAITGFTERAEPVSRETGPKATFSVGRIGGGTSVNSIPFESWMEVDMRSVDPRKLDRLDAAFREAVAEALAVENARRTEDEAMTAEIEPVGQRPAGEGDLTLPLIRHAIGALEARGMTPQLVASSTDANIPIWLGVPAVTISRGGVSNNAHSLNETWTDEDTLRSEQAALLLILLEAGLAG